MASRRKWLRALGWALLFTMVLFVAVVGWLWRDRPTLRELEVSAWSDALPSRDKRSVVRATWWGVSTLLVDDGETQILIDGFFSRPTLLQALTLRPVSPDEEAIEAALTRLGAERVAAVVAVHSHFDHLMDSSSVAERSGAMLLGSSSSATVARAEGLDADRILELPKGGKASFGQFEVELITSKHAPIGVDGEAPMPGEIESDFTLPAPITAWREGGSYSVLLRHPAGSILVQGSAGYVPGALANQDADIVLLGMGGLGKLDANYFASYWHEMVQLTKARAVVPIHFDDFSTPPDDDQLRLFPRVFDDLGKSFSWLRREAQRDGLRLERLPRRTPVELFSPR